MGTRSLTYVHDGDRKSPVIACIYQQFDGYPEGVGLDLIKLLKPITLINGIGGDQDKLGKFANGMGCLAAQLVSKLKKRVGGTYLYQPDTVDAGQDYNYHIYKIAETLHLDVEEQPYKEAAKMVFSGTPKDVAKAIQKHADRESDE